MTVDAGQVDRGTQRRRRGYIVAARAFLPVDLFDIERRAAACQGEWAVYVASLCVDVVTNAVISPAYCENRPVVVRIYQTSANRRNKVRRVQSGSANITGRRVRSGKGRRASQRPRGCRTSGRLRCEVRLRQRRLNSGFLRNGRGVI